MPLVKIERVRFATDQSMATITNTSGSAFRSALADLIQAIAVGIISGNPTIVAAAEAAVASALSAQRIVLSRVISSTGGTWTDLNAVDATLPVALDVRNTALNRPITAAVSCVGWHIPSGNGSAAQLLTTSGTVPSQWMRSKAAGVWGPWVRIVDTAVLDARVAGLAAELGLVQLEKCIHFEAGVWVWDGPAAPAATHYLVPDDTGALVARSTPFPVPSASAPELNW